MSNYCTLKERIDMQITIIIIIIQALIIYACYLNFKKQESEKMEIRKNVYNEVLNNLYSQYSKAIDELNLEKASFLLYNIRIVKFGKDKENKDVQDLS